MIVDETRVSQCQDELEREFYGQIKDELVEDVRRHTESEFLRRDLMRRSGLRDQQLIEELIRLDVKPESLIAIRLVPLVMVAWADQRVTPEESVSVQREAAKMGIGEETVPGKLLEAWLQVKPDPEIATAWKRYAHLLMVSMSDEMCGVYISELRREMRAIARASGGAIGIGKISEKEQLVIDRFTRLAHSAK